MANIRSWLRAMLSITWFAMVFAFALAAVMLLHGWSADLLAPHPAVIPFVLLFATLGAIYGTVVALDSSAPRIGAPKGWIRQTNSPRLRAGLCALLGIAAGTILWMAGQRSFDWTWILLLGGLPGAAFGWLGWRCAKYIDF
ncbi:MAG: hypothetical protein V4679_03180 [Pseudomonadota bacterium]